MSDILGLRPATDLLASLRAGSLGSVELLHHLQDRYERLNPAVNAIVTTDFDGAAEQARRADAAHQRGESLGPLHGLPMTIKDAIRTAGLRSTGGADQFADHVPDNDSEVVAKVRAAGAIVFGKTNVPRFSGDLQTWNQLFGTTNNPWDLARTPGGSSGGAAAALAIGLTPLEIGTDIVCSVRQPAHFTGVCAHKPSYGVVPQTGLLYHPTSAMADTDINVVGPMARSVDDLALLLDVLAGPRADQASAWTLNLPPPRGEARSLRVAAWLDDPACPVSSETQELLAGVVEAIAADGIDVNDEARPGHAFDDVIEIGYPMILATNSAAASDAEFEQVLAMAQQSGLPEPMATGVRGTTLTHRDWRRLAERREQNRRNWAAFFDDHDVLLAPVCITTAIEHDHEGPFMARTVTVDGRPRPHLDLVAWTVQFGYTHLPVTVIPVGTTGQGLPLGIQIVGPYLDDRTVLTFARYLESLVGPIGPPPMAGR